MAARVAEERLVSTPGQLDLHHKKRAPLTGRGELLGFANDDVGNVTEDVEW